MAKRNHPQRGSHGFSPRKRAAKPIPRPRSWADDGDEPTLQGFPGYKAGMTHAIMTDYRPHSVTSGQEVRVPVTVIETPPLHIGAVRVYTDTPYGLKASDEAWAKKFTPEFQRRTTLPKGNSGKINVEPADIDEIRVIAYTQPKLVSGVDKKVPDMLEIRVGGKDIPSRLEFAMGLLGTEVKVTDVIQTGQQLDALAITKGYGFQGSVQRWGVKLQSHKSSKNRRDTSPLGPFRPPYIRWTVPMGGQQGYHQRTDYNKRCLKMGDNGADITPSGGFLHYGDVKNPYVALHGSVPGPAKRFVLLRHAVRYHRGIDVKDINISHLSTSSKQGA